MWATFRHELAHMRGQILGWGVSLGLLGAYFTSVFNSFQAQMEQLRQVMGYFPPELFEFFGIDLAAITPLRMLDLKFFSMMPIILGIFAVLACSNLLAGDEEKGLLDLVLAHPVSRRALFFGKFLAFVAAFVAILLITWVAIALFMDRAALQVTPIQMLWPMVSLFATVLIFGALALFLSMVLPSPRMAWSVSLFLAIASFFVKGMAEIEPNLRKVSELLPYAYYQGGQAAFGLNVGWVVGLIVPAIAFMLLAWWRFERRDIRVAGESGWQVVLPARLRPARRRLAEARPAA